MTIMVKRKTSIQKVTYFFIISTICFVGSCQKDSFEVTNEAYPETVVLSSEIISIKDEFQQKYSEEKTTRSSTEDYTILFKNLYPLWEKAFTEEKGNEKIVLVPIIAPLKNVNINFDCAEKYRQTKDEWYLNTQTLLCFKTNKQTNEEAFFFMSITPSVHYLESNNFDLSKNLYFTRDSLFDGKVLYHDIFSNFVNGWEYTEGKITGYEYPKNQSSTRSTGGTTCFEVWTVTAVDYYYTVNGGAPKYNFTRYTFSSSYHCVASTGSGNQSAIWWIDDNSSTGGEDGGGGYAPSSIEPNDKIKSIAKTVDMTKEQVPFLNRAIDEFIDEGCMQKALYDALVVKNVKIDFGMMTNTAPGGYNPRTKKISFSNNEDITSETLKEELFHAWQDAFYPGGISQYLNVGKVNIEFEAKLFKDISRNLDYGCCYIFGEDNIPSKIKNDYYSWIESIQNNPALLLKEDYGKWLDLFNQYYPNYSSPKNNNLSLPSSLDKLINISNCF